MSFSPLKKMTVRKLTLLKMFGSSMDQLERNELEATTFKARDDVTNEPALDAIGLGLRK
jgi:hypothetical protein